MRCSELGECVERAGSRNSKEMELDGWVGEAQLCRIFCFECSLSWESDSAPLSQATHMHLGPDLFFICSYI